MSRSTWGWRIFQPLYSPGFHEAARHERASTKPVFAAVGFELLGRQCFCDLVKNREGISLWHHSNCAESAKVDDVFFADVRPQDQDTGTGASKARSSRMAAASSLGG